MDYNNPLEGSLLTNQDSMESKKVFFFVAHFIDQPELISIWPI